MADQAVYDPYALKAENIQPPPTTFGATMKLIGPGLILASSIVGSGELIATTVLGAENGYILLWLILLSCVVKTVVQNELGRYAIATGKTTLEAFDQMPGPRFKVSWLVWMWALMVTATLFQIGAMLGGISEILNRLFPAVSITIFVWILAGLSILLLIAGKYSMVERIAMGLVVSFTALTVSCCFLLFKLPQYFDWSAVLEGLTFQPPEGGMGTAVAAFGITGVGASELVMYPYWCIEKGYAQYAGKRDDSDGWTHRAFGWIRVMGVDVVNSMVIYTFATVAFYFLGAGVLKGMGLVPAGSEMVHVLSNIYTQTLGEWSLPLFMVGAFAVLYSTVFAATAANCRVWADFVGMLGFYDKNDYKQRLRVTRFFVVFLLVVPCLYFMLLEAPVLMVKIGGIAQAIMLPVIGFFAVYIRYYHMPKRVLPKGWITLMLWVSSVLMAVFMSYSAISRL